MPPRHNYWTIIFGGQPTSFRTATREELLPTFKQIQSKNPDAVMMWFARGRLWKSEEEARQALIRARAPRRDPRGPRPEWTTRPPRDSRAPRPAWRDRPPRPEHKDRWRDRPARPPGPPGPPRSGEGGKPHGGGRPRSGDSGARGRDWRPGGAHKDPRDRFKVPRDVKRAKMAKKFGWKKDGEDRGEKRTPRAPKKKDEE